jgi:hypothetical protein
MAVSLRLTPFLFLPERSFRNTRDVCPNIFRPCDVMSTGPAMDRFHIQTVLQTLTLSNVNELKQTRALPNRKRCTACVLEDYRLLRYGTVPVDTASYLRILFILVNNDG